MVAGKCDNTVSVISVNLSRSFVHARDVRSKLLHIRLNAELFNIFTQRMAMHFFIERVIYHFIDLCINGLLCNCSQRNLYP